MKLTKFAVVHGVTVTGNLIVGSVTERNATGSNGGSYSASVKNIGVNVTNNGASSNATNGKGAIITSKGTITVVLVAAKPKN